jgi:predicted nucleotidyltransferase component of viral defense system
MRKPVKNMAASVRDRLLKIAKERNETFDLLLTRYTLERFLYRLSITKHKERFALKGALLLTTWFDNPHRATRDVDLLGFGDSKPDEVLKVLGEVCSVEADDGVTFDAGSLAVDRNREELEYGGLRVTGNASVGGAKVRVVIDIGYGDATEPGLTEISLPVLLDAPAPKLKAYPKETVIAEKLQAMVALGRANSRMKDFYDVWFLANAFEFTDDRLARAIVATFNRRKTEIPSETPDALTDAFADDQTKQQQWKAFASGVASVAGKPADLKTVITELREFLALHIASARTMAKSRK